MNGGHDRRSWPDLIVELTSCGVSRWSEGHLQALLSLGTHHRRPHCGCWPRLAMSLAPSAVEAGTRGPPPRVGPASLRSRSLRPGPPPPRGAASPDRAPAPWAPRPARPGRGPLRPGSGWHPCLLGADALTPKRGWSWEPSRSQLVVQVRMLLDLPSSPSRVTRWVLGGASPQRRVTAHGQRSSTGPPQHRPRATPGRDRGCPPTRHMAHPCPLGPTCLSQLFRG
jgi:hypothetical protein